MSRFLSLSAFAAEVGWSQDEILRLIQEDKIKAYQLTTHEPYIPKDELEKVKAMAPRTHLLSDQEAHLKQDEADRVSRAHSRSKIAAEREALEAKAEERRSALAQRRANRQHDAN